MNSQAIQIRDPRSLSSSSRTRPILGRAWSGQARRMNIPSSDRTAVAERKAVEPVLSIEDAIRRYVEAQPAQLYRGGL